MKPFFKLIIVLCVLAATVRGQEFVRGFTLTEIGNHVYDAYHPQSGMKSSAQLLVDKLYDLGIRHVILSPRALMRDPRGSFVVPYTPYPYQQDERERYLRLIDYIHQKRMTVGIRPVLFVTDDFGGTPLVETLPDGSEKIWWHGNIEPLDPASWFESFRAYLNIYVETARLGRVEEFTIGAELQSMLLGSGRDHLGGHPEAWLNIAKDIRAVLPPGIRIMYDANYTDEVTLVGGEEIVGGEYALLHHAITRYSRDCDAGNIDQWNKLVSFVNELDAIGIDLYRSLAFQDDVIPSLYSELLGLLLPRAEMIARDLQQKTLDIETVTLSPKRVLIKEVGFRSVEKGFIDPYLYAGSGVFNEEHQAAAYEAILRAFLIPGLDRIGGISFWDVSVNLDLHGPFDLGFSPIGKDMTEEVIRRFMGMR